jgi:hypothetical protein
MPALMTVRDCVNQTQFELGISQRVIPSVLASFDQDVVQMLALLSAVADEVLLEEPYKITLGDGMWLADAGGASKPSPTADSDVILFDARLAVDGLKYRFLKAKGLEFGEEMRDFTTRLNKLAGRVNTKVIDLERDDGRQL